MINYQKEENKLAVKFEEGMTPQSLEKELRALNLASAGGKLLKIDVDDVPQYLIFVIARVVGNLFSAIAVKAGEEYIVAVSFCEIQPGTVVK
ncbi:MAG: hypothetical protein K5930_01310 [Treponemataceae bacterium]|nr:hypothetical protein [Treponemataceae bacterium]